MTLQKLIRHLMIKTNNKWLKTPLAIPLELKNRSLCNEQMKYILLTLLIISGACIANEKASYSGAWLNKNYYERLKESKSPKKSQAGSRYVVIPEESVSSLDMTYNFHEGVSMPIDSLKGISDNEIEIDGERFIKINSYPSKTPRGPRIAEDLIFKGKYLTPKNKIVKFGGDGTITGFGHYKYYYVQLDYYDVGLDIDMMILGEDVADTKVAPYNYSKWLGFKFDNEYLKLYKIKCEEYVDSECYRVGYGEVAYTLIRIKM